MSYPLPIVRTVPNLRAKLAAWRSAHRRVALVPTMGALHAGHLSLVALAREAADRVVTTIFVNPKQFGAGEDLDRYPRAEADDAMRLADAGCDLLFAPAVDAVYPPGFTTTVHVAGLGDTLDGASRPGHFDGVATVVTKLLLQVMPDIAIFGEKDWQQLAIIRRMVADLDISVDVRGGPIVRDTDGLALSSRNVYLTPAERAAAIALPRALDAARTAIAAGAAVGPSLDAARAALIGAGFVVDYIELVRADDLAPTATLVRPARLLAAARIGTTRLIDNAEV